MSWGGLNPALTAWREGINLRFPSRGTGSDGGYADKLHGSTSQHQPDKDGSVDAFDNDVNYLGSGIPTGNPTEKRILEALKLDFESDRRSHLWISNRVIANRDIGNFRERYYSGESPHDHHCHWESEPAHERDGSPWKYTNTDKLLRDLNGLDMDEKTVRSIVNDCLADFFTVGQQANDGGNTSKIGRDAFSQGVPNPFAGKKTPVWALLEDMAGALKAATEGPVDPTGK